MHKIFEESPSRRADYEKVALATNEDYPLLFCATRWVENESVAKKANKIWSKMVLIVEYWKTLPKYKQPGKGDPKANKIYQVLVHKHKDPLVPLCLSFVEQIAGKLNTFLCRFQTDAPMVPFLVDSLEDIVRDLCSKFILDDIMEKVSSTRALLSLNVLNPNKQKATADIGYRLKR